MPDFEPSSPAGFTPSGDGGGGVPAAPENPISGAAEPGPANPSKSETSGWYDGPSNAEVVKGEVKPEASQGAESNPAGTDGTATATPGLLSIEDLKLPEGVSLDAEGGKAFVDLLNNAELGGKDRGQALIDLHQKEITRVHKELTDHQQKVWNDLNTGWRNDLRNDKELGGQNLDTTLSRAKAVIEEFLPPEGVKALLAHTDINGMGNYPWFVRLLNNVGKAMNVFEDGIVVANPKPPRGNAGSGNRGWYGGGR